MPVVVVDLALIYSFEIRKKGFSFFFGHTHHHHHHHKPRIADQK
jgi:hypothetical protein